MSHHGQETILGPHNEVCSITCPVSKQVAGRSRNEKALLFVASNVIHARGLANVAH